MNTLIPYWGWVKAAIAAVVVAAAFGSGWYLGETHVIKTEARATASIGPKAAKAQADQDTRDRKAADLDQQKRAGKNDAGEVKYKILYRDRTKLVPAKGCKVPAAAMKLLNDPALIDTTP